MQFGTLYRLSSPFEGNVTAWMAVNENRKDAIVGLYRVLNLVNAPYTRLTLRGLDPELCYKDSATRNCHYGDELMNIGLITTDSTAGQVIGGWADPVCDFDSRLIVLTAAAPPK